MLTLVAIGMTPASQVGGSEVDGAESIGPVLEFVDETMDLGTLTLADLELFRRDIEFVNKGDQPLILSNVRGCCGTRITDWPQAPLMPGESGRIATQFRLAARPHTVRRTITVTSNATEPTKVHRITGTVVAGATPAPDTPTIGPQLLFLQDRLDFGTLTTDELENLEARVEIENQGDQPLQLRMVRGGAGATVMDFPEAPIAPGERGMIHLQVQLEKRPHRFNQHLFVVANTETQRYTYRISGVVVEP